MRHDVTWPLHLHTYFIIRLQSVVVLRYTLTLTVSDLTVPRLQWHVLRTVELWQSAVTIVTHEISAMQVLIPLTLRSNVTFFSCSVKVSKPCVEISNKSKWRGSTIRGPANLGRLKRSQKVTWMLVCYSGISTASCGCNQWLTAPVAGLIFCNSVCVCLCVQCPLTAETPDCIKTGAWCVECCLPAVRRRFPRSVADWIQELTFVIDSEVELWCNRLVCA